MAQRLMLDADQEINGPFPTIDAVAAVGYENVMNLAKTGGIFWADHSKRTYYAFQEVTPKHAKNVSWVYSIPNPLDQASVQYGRVKIMRYENHCLVVDSFSKEVYYAPTLMDSFDIAVSVVHFFPNSRMLPELAYDRRLLEHPPDVKRADFQALTSQEQMMVWADDGKAPVSLQRTVSLSLSDAISILMGDRPSDKLMADIAMTYPQALVATYGPALVCYDPKGTQLTVAQSITSLSLAQDITPREGFDGFASNYTVGKYRIVSGWGYRLMLEVMPDINAVAVIDLALAHASSPEIAKATVAGFIESARVPHGE